MLNTAVGKAGRHINSLVAQVPDIDVRSTPHVSKSTLQAPQVQSGLIVMSSSACRSLLNSFRSLSSEVTSSRQQVKVCSVSIVESHWNSSYMRSFLAFGFLGFTVAPTAGLPMLATLPSSISAIAARSALFDEGATVTSVLEPTAMELAPGSAWKQACLGVA